jgi:DNA-binding Xre family transcriptional regulator
MESIELQKIFFQHIKSKLANHVSFVEDIADLLGISTDSSYRRIRGEKPITFDEIQKLCRHYQVSLDHILSINSNSTVFFGNWVDVEHFDFEKYLTDMLNQLNLINKSETKIMYYEAKDIPPFHHFQFPELAAFKYFFWMKTILSYPEYSRISFEECTLRERLAVTGKEIIRVYSEIPSTEIWSAETINSTIRQIEFYKDSEVFSKKETLHKLYNELKLLVNHIEKQAEEGEKYLVGATPKGVKNFQLFFNEVFLGHNSIMTETDSMQTVFINHGILNYMMTRDKNFCSYTKKTMENTMKKSSLISSVNEKERHRFFHILNEKIDRRIKIL